MDNLKDEQQSASAKVTFEPTGRSVWVLPGTLVTEAAGQCGLAIDAPCGGAGTCGKCRVRFMSGAPQASDAAGEQLSPADLEAGWRLACQAKITTDTVIAIPETSLFTERLQILTDSEAVVEASAPPIPHTQIPVDLVEGQQNFAVAFDVGTTTLVGELLELPSGAERAVVASINPQVSFGDDVVSRIGWAIQNAAKAAELRDAVRGAIDDLLGQVCKDAGITRDEIRAISLAGNTTMQHLLCSLDVSSLSVLPFEPARQEAWVSEAAELGLTIAPGGKAFVLPVIGGFVGGDTVAGILATDMTDAAGPTLMIDIGTNGEIVLAADGQLLAASAAAGPAFEGARISSGMRAAAGAIEKVIIARPDGLMKTNVIGGAEPIGLCGSAIVDIAAEMLRWGLMDPMGRILPIDELPADIPGALAERLREDDRGQMEFVLSVGRDGRPDVTIQQRDFRELQLATGALRAGVGILLKQAGLKPADLERVLIAGGFGSFIRRNNAQRIGLIPADVPPERIGYVGNVSLHGAKRVLISTAAREQTREISSRTRHVELSADMEFQMAFAEAMIFPES
ncbi:MAG: ASKHA domain-containing protein [Phycisphaerae bacterium]|nr:ASKHA domain-containing protein [Phycisphaerae bacterium]